MIAGVEYGKFVPGMTLAMGIRMPRGWEFGMGPNVVASKDEYNKTKARTSLIIALGKSLNYGGVSIPINLAVSTVTGGESIFPAVRLCDRQDDQDGGSAR